MIRTRTSRACPIALALIATLGIGACTGATGEPERDQLAEGDRQVEDGRLERALELYESASTADPSATLPHLAAAVTLIRLDRPSEARARLEAARGPTDDAGSIRLALARLLAASPLESDRDVRRAAGLAQEFLTPSSTAAQLETMALVAAGSGMYPQAAQLQSRAEQVARRAGDEAAAQRIADRLAAFRRGEPVAAPWTDDDPVLAAGGYRLLDPEAADTRSVPEILEHLVERADPRLNPYLNRQRADALLPRIEAAPTPQERNTLRLEWAWEMLRAGASREAVDAVDELIRTYREAGVPEDHADMRLLYDLRAIAWLRFGEQRNCIERHTSESCLMPIRGEGVHADPTGSQRAIESLHTLLETRPDDAGYRWLLNLAHMTLGSWPDGVPAGYRIPPEVFASDAAMPRYPDVAASAGLDADGLSGGVVTEDLDGDGLLDVMVSSWGLRDPLRVFINAGDGRFVERTAEAGLDGQLGGLNLIHADYDNDGDADVMVLRGAWLNQQGRYPNSLLRNDGGRFTDVTREAGVLSFHPTQAAAWRDFDRDGRLDLIVANESAPGDPHPSELYRNRGDGTFENVSDAAGVGDLGFAKAVTWGDADGDGWPDLYVSRYLDANLLLHNEAGPNGTRVFRDVTRRAGVAAPSNSFPVWFWDYDNDGDDDLLAASFADFWSDSLAQVVDDYLGRGDADRVRVYRNDGRGLFEDVSRGSGMHDVLLAMGANYGDLDNDGWLDAYFGTGLPRLNTLVPNRMYRSNGDGGWLDVTTAGGFGHLQKGHGIAFADLDNDGDQDIYAVMGGAFSGDTYRNALFLNPGNANRWVTLRLVGERSNRAAVGARIAVTVQTPRGERIVRATVGTGGSFGSSSLQQELGLGDATSIRSVEVRWPIEPPVVDRFEGLPLDAVVELREGGAWKRIELPVLPLGEAPHAGHHSIQEQQ